MSKTRTCLACGEDTGPDADWACSCDLPSADDPDDEQEAS